MALSVRRGVAHPALTGTVGRHALPASGLGLAVTDRSAATQAHRKTWSDLTRRQRVGIGVGTVLQVSFQVAALVDLHRRSAREVNGEKRMWVALSFINFLGPAAYFKFGRKPQSGWRRPASAAKRALNH